MSRTFRALMLFLLSLAAISPLAISQTRMGTQLAELGSLKDKVRDPDTRVRVDASLKRG
jgi:hypothetical protein